MEDSSNPNTEFIKKEKEYSDETPYIEMTSDPKNTDNTDKNDYYLSNSNSQQKGNDETNPEKPYYENANENNNSKPKENENCCSNCCSKCCLGLSHCFTYSFRCCSCSDCIVSTDKYLVYIRALIIFFFDMLVIFILIILGFIFYINKVFIKTSKTMWYTLISTSVAMTIMSLYFHYFDEKDRHSKIMIIFLILYIPCICFYLFLLSDFMNYNYIICGVLLYLLDILSYIVTLKSLKEVSYGPFMILSSAITIITLILFHYFLSFKGLITFFISLVGLSEIIYLLIVPLVTKKYLEDNEVLFVAYTFAYALFIPFAYLAIFTLFLYLYALG